MKKRGHGVGKWNGPGGKAQDNESFEQAAIRETKEEIGITPLALTKVAGIIFKLPPEKNYDQFCTVFICGEWRGKPRESEEMRPQWFSINALPYEEMWESDTHWLPEVLAGKLVKVNVDASQEGHMKYTSRSVKKFN